MSTPKPQETMTDRLKQDLARAQAAAGAVPVEEHLIATQIEIAKVQAETRGMTKALDIVKAAVEGEGTAPVVAPEKSYEIPADGKAEVKRQSLDLHRLKRATQAKASERQAALTRLAVEMDLPAGMELFVDDAGEVTARKVEDVEREQVQRAMATQRIRKELGL